MDQLYSTVSLLPYAELEEVDLSGLSLVRPWQQCSVLLPVQVCDLHQQQEPGGRIAHGLYDQQTWLRCLHNQVVGCVQTSEGWIALMDACAKCTALQVLTLKGCALGTLGNVAHR